MSAKTLVSRQDTPPKAERAPNVRVVAPPRDIVIPPPPRANYQFPGRHEVRVYTYARKLGLPRKAAAWTARNRQGLAGAAIVAVASTAVIALVRWLTRSDAPSPAAPPPPRAQSVPAPTPPATPPKTGKKKPLATQGAKADLHEHVCACGNRWKHSVSSLDDTAAHTCPACGEVVWHNTGGGV